MIAQRSNFGSPFFLNVQRVQCISVEVFMVLVLIFLNTLSDTHSHNPLTFDVCCRYKSKTPAVPLDLWLYIFHAIGI